MRSLLLVQMLGMVSFFLTLASVPAWAVGGGASVETAGSVTTAMLGCTVVVQFAVPAVTSRIGLRRALPLSLLLLGVPCPLLAVSHGLVWLIVLSLVRGAGFAILTVLGTLVVARLAAPDRRGEAVGIYGLASAGVYIVIPVGVALTLAHHFAWVAIISLAPVLAVPSAIALAAKVERKDGQPFARTYRWSRNAVAAIRPAAALFATALAGGGLVTFLPIVRPSGQLAAATLLSFGLATAAGRLLAGLVADRVAVAWLLQAAVTMSAAGLIGVAGALGIESSTAANVMLISAVAFFGAGVGSVQNLTLLAALSAGGDRDRATMSAIWNAALDAGTGLGALAVGLGVGSGLGLRTTLALCAVLVILTAPLAYVPPRIELAAGD